jgi:predicted ArsR family transcriptional regulator
MALSTPERIVSYLKRRKTPCTADVVAFGAKTSEDNARHILKDLSENGKVKIVGTRKTGKAGRPANLYLL